MALETFLNHIIPIKALHTKWLNTLSFLENCGARKIAAFEDPMLVKKEMLKHAAEEFRHAHSLKQQIQKLDYPIPSDYSMQSLFGGWKTIHYLDRLESKISRFQKKSAYLLVTYAIEKRAQKIYPLYQNLLKQYGSKVSVKSILLEEVGHLEEIEKELAPLRESESLKQRASALEETIYQEWIKTLNKPSII